MAKAQPVLWKETGVYLMPGSSAFERMNTPAKKGDYERLKDDLMKMDIQYRKSAGLPSFKDEEKIKKLVEDTTFQLASSALRGIVDEDTMVNLRAVSLFVRKRDRIIPSPRPVTVAIPVPAGDLFDAVLRGMCIKSGGIYLFVEDDCQVDCVLNLKVVRRSEINETWLDHHIRSQREFRPATILTTKVEDADFLFRFFKDGKYAPLKSPNMIIAQMDKKDQSK